jgi:Flp pilus assembly protein TadG
MSHIDRERNRGGVVALETAFVLPVLFFLLLALIVWGTGVFNYQLVACLAREGARWTAVRGDFYQRDLGASSPTTQDVLQQAVLPFALGLDPAALSIQVQWVDQATGVVQDWDASPKAVQSITPLGECVTNTVRVTVTYQWTPGLLLGSMTLSSTSEIPMAS